MAWTDPTLSTSIKIRSVHINELRAGVESLEAVSCPTHNTSYNTTVHTTNQSSNNTTVYSSKNSTVYSYYKSSDFSSYGVCSTVNHSNYGYPCS